MGRHQTHLGVLLGLAQARLARARHVYRHNGDDLRQHFFLRLRLHKLLFLFRAFFGIMIGHRQGDLVVGGEYLIFLVAGQAHRVVVDFLLAAALSQVAAQAAHALSAKIPCFYQL